MIRWRVIRLSTLTSEIHDKATKVRITTSFVCLKIAYKMYVKNLLFDWRTEPHRHRIAAGLMCEAGGESDQRWTESDMWKLQRTLERTPHSTSTDGMRWRAWDINERTRDNCARGTRLFYIWARVCTTYYYMFSVLPSQAVLFRLEFWTVFYTGFQQIKWFPLSRISAFKRFLYQKNFFGKKLTASQLQRCSVLGVTG